MHNPLYHTLPPLQSIIQTKQAIVRQTKEKSTSKKETCADKKLKVTANIPIFSTIVQA